MAPLNATLKPTGRFNNVSEIVRAGLRLLEDEEMLREIVTGADETR